METIRNNNTTLQNTQTEEPRTLKQIINDLMYASQAFENVEIKGINNQTNFVNAVQVMRKSVSELLKIQTEVFDDK